MNFLDLCGPVELGCEEIKARIVAALRKELDLRGVVVLPPDMQVELTRGEHEGPVPVRYLPVPLKSIRVTMTISNPQNVPAAAVNMARNPTIPPRGFSLSAMNAQGIAEIAASVLEMEPDDFDVESPCVGTVRVYTPSKSTIEEMRQVWLEVFDHLPMGIDLEVVSRGMQHRYDYKGFHPSAKVVNPPAFVDWSTCATCGNPNENNADPNRPDGRYDCVRCRLVKGML